MISALDVRYHRLPHARGLPAPTHATAGSVGSDLHAAVEHPVVLAAGERALVPTGIAIALPAGFEAQVRPRSGLAAKSGVTVLNSPGTIDNDFRGEIKVILINHGDTPFEIVRGARVAQLVVAPVTRVTWTEAEGLDATARGAGGFGSTG